MFEHTYLEKGMWRGWLKDDQSLEVCWGESCNIGAGFSLQANENDEEVRKLNIAIGIAQVFIPLGLTGRSCDINNERGEWSLFVCRSDLVLNWRKAYRRWEMPFTRYCVEYQGECEDGEWRKVVGREYEFKTEAHPYSYRRAHWKLEGRHYRLLLRSHGRRDAAAIASPHGAGAQVLSVAQCPSVGEYGGQGE